MDVAYNLSYTGTETARGKEEDTPFPEAITTTAVSFLLLTTLDRSFPHTAGDLGSL